MKAAGGRLSGPNPYGDALFTERNWRVLDALRAVATALGEPPARVALAWVAARPGVTAPITGASNLEQLRGNLAALDLVIPPEQARQLDEASAIEAVFPYPIFTPEVNRSLFGGNAVAGWQELCRR